MRSRRSVHPSWVLILLSVLSSPVWGANYTWNGGGGADTSWTNNANWGGGGHPSSSADNATINGVYTVTLTANATVGTLDFDFAGSGLVTFNLGGKTLTATTINFGQSGGSPPACNVDILGPGTVTTGTLDTAESQNNVVNFSNNVSFSVTGTFWGNQNPGKTTTYSGDGTCTLTLSATLGSDPTVVFDNLTVVSGGVSYSVAVSGAKAPGQTVVVTVTGGFGAATQFRYKADRTNSNATTNESYTLRDKDGLNPITIPLGALTNFPNTSAAGTFQFQLEYPGTIDDGDGLNFIVYNPAGTMSIGSVAFTASSSASTWLGGHTGSPTDWSDPLNWSTGAVPTGTSVVTIPVTSNNPVLTAPAVASTVKVDLGASLDLAGFNLTGVTTFTNNGTVRLQGTETVAGTKATGASSTVEYYGAGAVTPVWGTAYQNLTVSGATTVLTLGAGTAVNGNLTVSSGELVTGAHSLTLSGPSHQVTGGKLTLSSGGTVSAGTNALTIGPTGTLDTSGTLTVGNFASTGTVTNSAVNTVSASGTVSVSGTFSGAASSSLTMTGTKTLSAAVPLGNLALAGTNTVTLSGSALSLAGSLTIGTGTTLTDAVGNLGITVSGTTTISGTLSAGSGSDSFATVTGAGSLGASSGTTTVTGDLTVAGFTHNSGTLVMGGAGAQGLSVSPVNNLTINGGGTVTLGANLTVAGNLAVTSGSLDVSAIPYGLTLGGNLSGAGTLVPRTGTVTFTGTGAQTASAFTFYNVVVNKGGGSLAMTNPTMNGWSTGASKAFSSSFPSGGSSATAVTFDNTGSLSIANGFTFTLGVTATLPSSVTLGGTIGSTNQPLNFGAGGGVTLAADTVLSSGSAKTTLGGTLAGGGFSLTLNTMGATSAFGGVVTALANLTVNTGTTFSLGGNATLTGLLTVTGSTVAVAGSTLTFGSYSGTGDTVTTTSGTLTVPGAGAGGTIGTLTVTTGATLNGGTGATGIVVTGTVGGNLTTSGKVTLSGTGVGTLTNSGTLTLSGNVTTSGTLTNTGGTVVVGGSTLTFPAYTGGASDTVTIASGTLTVPGAGAGGTIGTLTVTTGATLNGGTGTTGIVVTGAVVGNLTTTGKVTLNGTGIGTLTNSGTLTLNGNATLSGTLTQTAGSLTVPNGDTLTLNGATNAVGSGSSLVISSGGVVTAGTNSLSIAGTLNTSGSLTAGDFTSTGTITNTATNSITASGNIAISGTYGGTPNFGTLILTGATSSLTTAVPLGNLTVNATATGATLGSTLSLGGTLLVNALGVLSTGAFGLTVTGTTTVNGTLNAGSGTDQFAALGGTGTLSASTGSTTLSGGLSVTTFTHNNGTVTLTGGSTGAYTFSQLFVGGAVSATGDWTVAGNLTISGGANWTAGAHTHSVAGNWSNSGTFTGAGSTVVFTGAGSHLLTGATTFANLSDTVAGSTLTLTTGTTFGVSGTLTLTGAAGNLITVQSSTATVATLGNTGAQSVSFVRVSHVVALVASITAATSADLTGDNTNWVFTAVSWLTTGTTDANLASNWASGVVPGQYDTATVPSGGTQPTQTGALSLKGLVTQASGTWSNGGQNLTLGASSLANSGTFTYTGTGTLSALPTSLGGTFVYSGGTLSLLATPTTYTNLTISGGTITAVNATVTGTTSVTGGTLTVPGGVTLNLAVTTVSAAGTVGTSGTVNVSDLSVAGAWNNGASNTVTASGNVSITGTYGTPGSGTLALPGAGKTLGSTAQLGNLSVTGTPKLTAPLSLAGNLLITAGSLDMNGNAVTMAGSQLRGTVINTAAATSPAFQATSGLTLAGTTSLTTFTTSAGGSVTFSGSVDGAQTLTVSAGSGAVSFGTVGASPALASLTVTTTGTLALGGVTTTGAQSYTAGGGATLNGNLTTTTTAIGVIGFTASTPVLLGADVQVTTLNSAVNFSSTVNGTHALTLGLGSGTATPSAAIGGLAPPTGLTLNSGTLALGAQALTVNGSVAFAGGTLSGTSAAVAVRGDVTRSSGGFNLTLTSNLTLDGTSASQSVDLTGSTLASLTVNNTSGSPTVTVSAYPTTWSGNLVLTGGTLVLSSNASLTIGGNLTGLGTLNASAIAGTLTVNGTIGTNLAGIGSLIAPAGNLSVGGSQFNAATFNASGGTVTFTAASTIYSASTFAALTKSGVGITQFNTGVGLTATGNVTVTGGTLALANVAGSVGGSLTGAGTFDASALTSGSLVVTGSVTMAGTLRTPTTATGVLEVDGTAFNVSALTAPSGTLLFNGTSSVALTTNGLNFASLTLASGTKTVTATGVLKVTGNLEVGVGQTLNVANAGTTVTGTTNAVQTSNGSITGGAGGDLTFSGNFEIGSLTATPGNTIFGGASVVFHTFAANGGTVRFSGGGGQAWTTGGATLATLTLLGAGTAVTTTGSLTVSNLSLTTGTLTVAAADTLTLTGPPGLTGGTLAINGGLSASGISMTIGGSSVTVATQPFVTGAFSVTSGSFTQTGDNGANANTVASLSVSGTGVMNWDNASDGGTLTVTTNLSQAGGGSVNFHNKNVTFGGSLTGSVTLLDLTIGATDTVTRTATSSLTVLRNLTIQNGGRYNNASQPLTLGGGTQTGGTLRDLNPAGSLQNLGVVTLVAGGGATVKTLAGPLSMASLLVGASTTLATSGNNVTVTGALTGASGTVTASTTETLSVGSDFQVGTFNRGTGDTVVLSSATAGNAALNGGYTFTNLTVAKALTAHQVNAAGPTTVAGTLTLTTGTWTAAALSTLTLTTGSWDSSSATFALSAGTGTVVLGAAAPSITTKGEVFNNLTLNQGGTLATNVAVGGVFTAAASGAGGTLDLGTRTLAVAGAVNLKPGATGASLTAGSSTLSLTGAGSQSVTSNAQTWATVSLVNRTSGTVTFADAFQAATLSINGSGAYAVRLQGGGTVTNPVTFSNTGDLTVDAGFAFTGGATKTTAGIKTFTGTVTAAGTGVLDFGTAGSVVVPAAATTVLGGTSTGAITVISTSIGAGGTLTLGAGAASPVSAGAVDGTGTSTLVFNSTGGVTVSGAVGATAMNQLTLTQSGGTTFQSTVKATTATLTATTGTIDFQGLVTLTTLNTAASGYAVRLRAGGSVANAVTFSNTGDLTVDAGFTFTGGATKTTAGIKTFTGTVTAAGTGVLNFGTAGSVVIPAAATTVLGGTSTGAITVISTSIGAGGTLTLGAGTASTVNAGAIDGTGTSTLVFNSTGGVTVSGAVGATAMNLVTVTQSGGTTFQSTVKANTATLTATTGTIDFQGLVTLTTLNTAASGYAVRLRAGGSVANAVTFSNTGDLTVDAGFTFTGGATKTTAGIKTFGGTITAAGTGVLNFGTAGSVVIPAAATTVLGGTSTGAITVISTSIGAGGALTLGAGTASSVNTGAIDGTASSALVINTTGTVSVSGAVGTTAMNTVTLTQSGGATFQALNAATMTVTDTQAAQTVDFQGNLTLTSGLLVPGSANAFHLRFGTGTNTVAGATTLANTGTLTFAAGTTAFTGGLVATVPSTVNLAGTVSASGTGVLNLNAAAVVATATATVGGGSTGQITVGPATVNAGATLTLGAGAASPVVTAAVNGTPTSALTFNTSGTITVGGAVGATAMNLVTVTQSGGTTFQSTVKATTATLTATTGTIDFQGLVTLTTLNTAASGYAVRLRAGGSVANAVTFSNTGDLTVDAGFTFTGGATKTTAGIKTFTGTIFAAGTGVLNFGTAGSVVIPAAATTVLGGTSTGAITVISTSIGAGGTLTLGAGTASPVNTGAVDGTGTSTLVFNSTGGVTVSGAVGATAMNLVTVTQSGGTTFQSTVNAATATLTATTGTIDFQGATTLTTLNTSSSGYSVVFSGATATVTNAVAFLNTGTVTLGTATGTPVLTFHGGLRTSGSATNPTSTSVGGHVRTSLNTLQLGPTVLLATSVLSTTREGAVPAGASLTLTGALTGSFNLTTQSGTAGATVFQSTVGSAGARMGAGTGSTSLSLATGTGATFQQDVYLAGDLTASIPVILTKAGTSQAFNASGTAGFDNIVALSTLQNVDLTAATLRFTNAASDLQVGAGTVTLTGDADFTGGKLTGSASGTQDIVFATATASTTVTFGTVTFPAWTAGRNRLVFSGTQATTWFPNGQTVNDVFWAKTGNIVTVLGTASATAGTLVSNGNLILGGTSTVNLTDARVVLTGSGKVLSVGAGTILNLKTTVANGGTLRGIFLNNATSAPTVANSGTVNLDTTYRSGAASSYSPIHLSAGNLRSTWTGTDLVWTSTGDLALANLDYQGTTLSQHTGAFLYLNDDNVHLRGLTLLGTLDFGGFGGTDSHSLTLSGTLDYSDAGASLTNLVYGSGQTTVTFDNTSPVGLNSNGTGTGKNLRNLALTGSGLVTLGNSLALTGTVTQNAGAKWNLNAQTLLVQGNLTVNASAPADFVTLNSTVSLSGTLTVACSQPFWNLFLNAPSSTVTQGTNLTVSNRFAAFRGTWSTNGHNLTVGEDFVAYGVGYVFYAVNGTTYHPADDGELAATRATTYFENKLGYPYWTVTGPVFGPGQTGGQGPYLNLDSSTGYDNRAVAAFGPGYSVWSSVSGTYGYASPSYGNVTANDGSGTTNATAAFTLTAGTVLTVGRNFYDFGASMTAPGPWTLSLPAKWATVHLNAAKDTDWFGLPFAVALATGPGMSVTNSQANRSVAAAQTSAGGAYTPGVVGSSSPVWTSAVSLDAVSLAGGWDNTQPDIDTHLPASTRFDNLVEVTFTKPIRNQLREVDLVVNQTSTLDNLKFATGATRAESVWNFTAGTPGTPGEYTAVSNTGGADLTVLAFKTLDSETTPTWNTDATGASSGAAGSTDRAGKTRAVKPDIQVEKGRLYDLSGNPLVNHDGANWNQAAGAASTLYTATIDRARPVLYKVSLGQADKGHPPTTFEDGHNYWHLQWSEPVDLDTVVGAGINGGGTIGSTPSLPNSVSGTDPNVAAVQTFGDSYTEDGTPLAGKVQLTGLVQYSGNLYRGRRSLAEANPQTAQTTGGKTSNTLARSSTRNDLFVYLTGASSGLGLAKTWDGFWWGDTTSPAGQAYTVVAAYVNQVKDRSPAANPVEDEFVNWDYPYKALDTPSVPTEPKTTFTLGDVSAANKWEADAPTIAPYTVTGTNDEVIPYDSTGSADVINQVQFHVLANVANSVQAWDSQTGHKPVNRSNPAFYGVRDTSLSQFIQGFALGLQSGGGTTTSYNLSVATGVDNSLFNGGPPPATGFSTPDDGYFTVNLKPVPSGWKPTVPYTYTYSPFSGMATNLAGRLVAAKTGNAVDRTPPYITLTLAPNSGKKVYVQFSRTVQADSPTAGDTVLKDVFLLSGSANSLVSFVPTNPNALGYFQEGILTLANPFDPAEFATARIQAKQYLAASGNLHGNSTITSSRNDMDWTVTYPLSSLGIDLVQPVWASDGSGAEANQTGTANVIHNFAGGESLVARDITLQAKVFGGTTYTSLPLQLSYDFSVGGAYATGTGLWLPTGIFEPSGLSSNKVPANGNPSVRNIIPTGANAAGDLKTFLVPGGDPKMVSGNELQFIFRIGAFYGVRGLNLNDPTQLGVYRIPLKGVKTQKNGVTILHNVIDPTQGQKTQLLYTMKKSGVVTAQVFALDGSLVRVLHRGRQAPGDYTLFWDGKNEGGKIVARGIYFIRVVAPDTDETRNVMVIK